MPSPTSTERRSVAGVGSKRPNVLLISADQWRGDCLSAVGHECVKTPNVDALAQEGVPFRHNAAGTARLPAPAHRHSASARIHGRRRRGSPPATGRPKSAGRSGVCRQRRRKNAVQSVMPKSVGGFRTTSRSTSLILERIQILGRIDLKSSGSSAGWTWHANSRRIG